MKRGGFCLMSVLLAVLLFASCAPDAHVEFSYSGKIETTSSIEESSENTTMPVEDPTIEPGDETTAPPEPETTLEGVGEEVPWEDGTDR